VPRQSTGDQPVGLADAVRQPRKELARATDAGIGARVQDAQVETEEREKKRRCFGHRLPTFKATESPSVPGRFTVFMGNRRGLSKARRKP